VQMAFDRSARSQLGLSLVSWAVVVGLYFIARARGRMGAERRIDAEQTQKPLI